MVALVLAVPALVWANTYISIGDKIKYDNTVRYEADIKPLFQQYCSQCHSGAMKYEVAVELQDRIYKKFVEQRSMPPKYSNQPTDAEVNLVKKWIELGAKR